QFIHAAFADGNLLEIDFEIRICSSDRLADEQLEPTVVPGATATLLVVEADIEYPLHRLEERYGQSELSSLRKLEGRRRFLTRLGQAANVIDLPPAGADRIAEGARNRAVDTFFEYCHN